MVVRVFGEKKMKCGWAMDPGHRFSERKCQTGKIIKPDRFLKHLVYRVLKNFQRYDGEKVKRKVGGNTL